MEERRFQVFVSSTFLDLQPERAAVVSALLQMDAIPAGMELFPAADDDAWTLITRVIDSCDYYLLVIGGKYGSMDPETELSYTEKEYDYADLQKKPVMAFLHENPDELKLKDSEKDAAAREKLAVFRGKVQRKKHVKFWNGPEDLAGKVALSFAKFRQMYPAVGWIRGDAQTSTEALEELNELRKKVAEMERELGAARSGPPPEADGLAQGQESVHFEVPYSTEVQLKGDPSYQWTRWRGVLDAEELGITWDDLFGCVGPDLLDEASDRVVKSRIDMWLTQTLGDHVGSLVRESAKERGEEAVRYRNLEAGLSRDDFGTVVVQLRALGLVAKSERNRSVKDTDTYWTLTPYGDEHLTTLRAITTEEAARAAKRPDESGVVAAVESEHE